MDTPANRDTAAASLAAALDDLPTRYSNLRRCQFGAWLRTLPPDLRAKVWAAVDGTTPYRIVASQITKAGVPVSGSTINNHRTRTCNSCQAEFGR